MLQYFEKLIQSSTNLNVVTDELGRAIREIDETLQTLNLGISAWVTVQESSVRTIQIGYTKVGDNWGLAFKEIYTSSNERQVWLFNHSPRSLRIEHAGKISEVFDALHQRCVEFTAQIWKRVDEVKEILADIKAAEAV